ncbi:hypothetical protein BC936DRAFT_141677, partial [Jimgerdemannia flammicorona]
GTNFSQNPKTLTSLRGGDFGHKAGNILFNAGTSRYGCYYVISNRPRPWGPSLLPNITTVIVLSPIAPALVPRPRSRPGHHITSVIVLFQNRSRPRSPSLLIHSTERSTIFFFHPLYVGVIESQGQEPQDQGSAGQGQVQKRFLPPAFTKF